MDYRTDTFARRFKSAKAQLNSPKVQGIVSLKYRDDCVNSSEYSHFVDDSLKRNLGLDVDQLDGDFGGQAWLVKDRLQNRAILVEHETGLEILGAIGSVASLIALLPLISSAWTSLRYRFSRHRFDDPDHAGVEIRHFDHNNILIEERTPTVELYVLNLTLQDHSVLRQKVTELEGEVERLKKTLPKTRKNRSRKRQPKKR